VIACPFEISMTTPQTNILPNHKNEDELRRLLELDDEFRRQQGEGTGGHDADWHAEWDGDDGDGDGE
jgi:hypothetical protein